MKRTIPTSMLALALVAAAGASRAAVPARTETAVFAGGCFWTVEHAMEALPGVVSTTAGFSGGREPHPTYDQVSSETTGHREAVRVVFDPTRTSYAKVLDGFWHTIDPTDDGGQACDRGPSYRAAVFVSSPEQRRIAEQQKTALNGRFKGQVKTEIRDAGPFWPAEEKHQHFADRNRQRYEAYRIGCGRDARLKAVWGAR